MNRRDFLRIMALGAGWLMTNGWFSSFRKTSAAQREYYRILLLSDTHLPWRTKKHKTEEDQNEVWEQKTKILDDINSWDDVDEVDVLGIWRHATALRKNLPAWTNTFPKSVCLFMSSREIMTMPIRMNPMRTENF